MPRHDPIEFLSRARALASTAETRALYDAWAETYDDDVYTRLGITGTARIAALLSEHADSPAISILDIGCGTGAAGHELHHRGFANIDGLDLSAGMLRVARRRGIYRGLFLADLLQPLPLLPGSYDAIVSAGTFTGGHVDARPLPSLLGIVRAHGLMAFVVGSGFWSKGGFHSAIDALSAGRAVELLHCAEEPIASDGRDRGFFVVLRTRAGSRSER
jgi:predicted TPR repeat methyltransferase